MSEIQAEPTETLSEPTSPAEPNPMPEKIVTYKGFDKDFVCWPDRSDPSTRTQYEISQTYAMDGNAMPCRRGFHACEHPLDVLRYYPPATSRYAETLSSGNFVRHWEDTKIASTCITINAELHIPQLVERAIAWVTSRCSPAEANHTPNDNAAASATGSSGAASATGWSGAASATRSESVV